MGIASLVFIVAAIEGSNARANAVIEKLGPNALFVVGGFRPGDPRPRMKVLTHEDVKILSMRNDLESVSWGLIQRTEIHAQGESKETLVEGVSPLWLTAWDFRIDHGRGFTPEDYASFNKVTIVGWDLADLFFPGEEPLGKAILVGQTPYRIVGLYERRGKNPQGHSMDEIMFLPLPTYQKTIEPEYHYLSAIRMKVRKGYDFEKIEEQIKRWLEERHGEGSIYIISQTQVKKFLSMFSAGMSLFLAIASITALVVSGFVLSNIFYINIHVRRWEIGLRLALGATPSAIRRRFLAEAGVIASVGALLGTAVGFGGVALLMPMLQIPPVYPWESLLIALFFSLTVSMIAAWKPAYRASRFHPIESLRSRL